LEKKIVHQIYFIASRFIYIRNNIKKNNTQKYFSEKSSDPEKKGRPEKLLQHSRFWCLCYVETFFPWCYLWSNCMNNFYSILCRHFMGRISFDAHIGLDCNNFYACSHLFSFRGFEIINREIMFGSSINIFSTSTQLIACITVRSKRCKTEFMSNQNIIHYKPVLCSTHVWALCLIIFFISVHSVLSGGLWK
jgi:hypothetical protein